VINSHPSQDFVILFSDLWRTMSSTLAHARADVKCCLISEERRIPLIQTVDILFSTPSIQIVFVQIHSKIYISRFAKTIYNLERTEYV